MSLSPATMWIVIGISGVLTFGLRAFFILGSREAGDEPDSAPPSWLEVIAPAALGALVLPALLRPDGTWTPFGPESIAGAIAAIVAWRTRSTVWTILVGFASLLLLEAI